MHILTEMEVESSKVFFVLMLKKTVGLSVILTHPNPDVCKANSLLMGMWHLALIMFYLPAQGLNGALLLLLHRNDVEKSPARSH